MLDFVVNCFRDSFCAKFEDCFMAEISGLSSDYFQCRVWPDLWPGMASWCGLFLCVIAENLIAC